MVEQVVVPTGPSWTGFYVGVHAGGAFGNTDYGNDFVDPGQRYHLADDTYAIGVHGGFDYQFSSSWVAGLELAATRLNSEYAAFIPDVPAFSIDWNFSASGRLGYLVTPQTLFYGRIGYSAMDVEAIEGLAGTASGTVDGALIGVGVETFLSDNITARVDANYFLPSDEFVTDDFEAFEPHYLMLTAGLSYRLGAQNGSSYPVEPAPEMDWSGFYAGISGSYNHGLMDLDVEVPFSTVGPFGEESAGGGVFVGYDFQVAPSFVLGVEADATYLNAEFEDPTQNSLDPNAPTVFGTVDAVFALTARAGYVASPSTLIYVKGGFAGLLTEANEEFFPLDGGERKVLSAYQIGGGIESALTEKLTLRVEGLYTEATEGVVVNNSQPDQITLTPSLLTGRVGLAYRF